MITINLNDLTGLPEHFLLELSKFKKEFMSTEFLEHLEERWEIHDLIIRINQFCLQNEIIGFHYTRAYPKDIITKGLLSRSGREIRADFIQRHTNLFNEAEIEQIGEVWNRSFDESDKEHRDNHIFFNFTLTALYGMGSELLLENFGGEQVYWPLYEIEGIKDKLKNIGSPLIVKCSLNPKDLNTFIEHPWGKIATATFHRTLNPNAYQTDQDGYQHKSIPPEKIKLIEVNESMIGSN